MPKTFGPIFFGDSQVGRKTIFPNSRFHGALPPPPNAGPCREALRLHPLRPAASSKSPVFLVGLSKTATHMCPVQIRFSRARWKAQPAKYQAPLRMLSFSPCRGRGARWLHLMRVSLLLEISFERIERSLREDCPLEPQILPKQADGGLADFS